MQVPKLAPRFVPTLTEVIDKVSVAAADSSSATKTTAQAVAPEAAPQTGRDVTLESDDSLASPQTERLVAKLMQRLVPQMEDQVRKTLHAAVDVQAKALMMRLHQELEASVRQAVNQALANGAGGKSNPRRPL